MLRTLLVGVLVLGLLANGCAGRRYVELPGEPPAESASWDPPPQKAQHPVRDWCKDHSVAAGAATAVLVAGGILAAGVGFLAYELGQVH